MKDAAKKFWQWYEKHYTIHLVGSSLLFALQALHLYWMATHVLALKVFGKSYFAFNPEYEWLYILIDYTEIPAIIGVSLIYIRSVLINKRDFKSILYLFFLNIQWVHILWLTDEFVVTAITGNTLVHLPEVVVYSIIIIDFLEIPVMIETTWKAILALKEKFATS